MEFNGVLVSPFVSFVCGRCSRSLGTYRRQLIQVRDSRELSLAIYLEPKVLRPRERAHYPGRDEDIATARWRGPLTKNREDALDLISDRGPLRIERFEVFEDHRGAWIAGYTYRWRCRCGADIRRRSDRLYRDGAARLPVMVLRP